MARCVSFEELQGAAPSLNQAGVMAYGVRVRTTIRDLPELQTKLHFEPDDGIYSYVPNNANRSVPEAPVNFIIVYWSVKGGKVKLQ